MLGADLDATQPVLGYRASYSWPHGFRRSAGSQQAGSFLIAPWQILIIALRWGAEPPHLPMISRSGLT